MYIILVAAVYNYDKFNEVILTGTSLFIYLDTWLLSAFLQKHDIISRTLIGHIVLMGYVAKLRSNYIQICRSLWNNIHRYQIKVNM